MKEALSLILSTGEGREEGKERMEEVGLWSLSLVKKWWSWSKEETKGETEAEMCRDGIAAPGLGCDPLKRDSSLQ